MKPPIWGVRLVLLVALLTLRFLAAPVSARPDTPKTPNQTRFIFRMCAWSAARAAEPTPIASTALGGGGKGTDTFADGLSPIPQHVDRATRARLAAFASEDRPPSTPVRLSDVRRC